MDTESDPGQRLVQGLQQKLPDTEVSGDYEQPDPFDMSPFVIEATRYHTLTREVLKTARVSLERRVLDHPYDDLLDEVGYWLDVHLKYTPREAAEAATAFLRQVYEGQELQNIQLEEVDSSPDNTYWLITLSFDVLPEQDAGILSLALNQRQYKLFRVRKEDGVVESMRIRDNPYVRIR